jgi:hypothetical protein
MESSPSPGPPDEGPEAEPDQAPLGAGIDFTDPNSPLAPSYLRAGHVAAVGLLALVFVAASVVPLWHPGVWADLKVGERIVAGRALPEHEPFSPDPQAPFPASRWLTQVGLYGLHAAGAALAGGDGVRREEGGAELLHLAHVFLAVGSCALALAAYRRRGQSWPLACAGLVLVLALGPANLLMLRPELVGLFCFTCLLAALGRPVLSGRALVLVPVVLAAWANLHPTYPLGLALLLGCLLGRAVEAGWSGGSWSPGRAAADAQVRRLLGVLLGGTALAAVLNPHGLFLFAQTLRLARNPNLDTLREWQPLSWAPGELGAWAAGLAVAVLTQAASPRWLSPAAVLLLAGFGAGAYLREGLLEWWLLLLPWCLAPLWSAVADRWPLLRVETVLSFRKTLLAAMLVVLALLWSGPVQWLIRGHPRPLDQALSPLTPWRVAAELKAGPGEAGRWLPALAEALRRHYPDGRYRGAVFGGEAAPVGGDYLLWALAPDVPVLAYSDAAAFPPGYWKACGALARGEPGWDLFLAAHGVNLVVLDVQAPLADPLRRHPDWLVVPDGTGDPHGRLLAALRKSPAGPP